MLSFIPFLILIVLITCCIAVFGSATLDGASQVSLLVASAVSVLIGHFSKRLEWENLEKEISDKIASCTPAIIILLLIGAIGGTWMVAGIVPTMIYYGMQIIQPEVFLVSSSVLCALVSLMIGSSWTTVATIGLALMGIGKAHGFDDGWIAGSIITGAYFGDKLSPLSDTTVLASSVSGLRHLTLVAACSCADGCHDSPPLAVDGGAVYGHPVSRRRGLVGAVGFGASHSRRRWTGLVGIL